MTGFLHADIAAATPHAQATSTGTGNVQTLTAPARTVSCLISVTTNAARATFDGSTPTGTNGIVLPTGVLHWIPLARDIKFVSTAAGNSVVDVLWLA